MLRSTVPPEGESVSSEPRLLLGRPVLVGLVSLSLEASALDAGSGETSGFSPLVLGGGDPVDPGVVSDGLVVGVNKDHLEELEGSVLADPVRVQNAQVSALPGDALLGGGAVGPAGLELVDTLVHGLSVDDALGDGSLAAATSDSDSVDHVALLGLVAELSGLVGAAGAVHLVDHGQLSVLPGPHSEHESEHVRLLLSPELFKILVGTHLLYI